MSFRARSVIPADAYKQIKQEAVNLDNYAATISTRLDSDITADQLSGLLETMDSFKSRLQILSATTGIADYAKAQESDVAYDVVAEYVTLIATIADVITTIKATPIEVLIDSWGATGVVWATFTPAQTAVLKSKIETLKDTII